MFYSTELRQATVKNAEVHFRDRLLSGINVLSGSLQSVISISYQRLVLMVQINVKNHSKQSTTSITTSDINYLNTDSNNI